MGQKTRGKVQLSVYLIPEDNHKLEVFCKKHHNANHSTVIRDALELLYAQEEHR